MRPIEPFIVTLEKEDDDGDAVDLPSLAAMREAVRRMRDDAEAVAAIRRSDAAEAA